MTKTKNARPAVGAAEQARETAAFDGATSSQEHYTSAHTPRQPFCVADFLGRGQSAAVPMSHLQRILNVTSREIRLRIEAERRAGIPICSNCVSGYFIADNQDEASRFARSMKARANEIVRTANAVMEAFEGEVGA